MIARFYLNGVMDLMESVSVQIKNLVPGRDDIKAWDLGFSSLVRI
jgi:hypothetical protein